MVEHKLYCGEWPDEKKAEILGFIYDALSDGDDSDNADDADIPIDISRIPPGRAPDALEMTWDVLALAKPGETDIDSSVLRAMRKLLLKLTILLDRLPFYFYLEGVRATDSSSRGSGSFADLYDGRCGETRVALKRVRTEQDDDSKQASYVKQLCRESILLTHLKHDHILPFFGISADAFHSSVCMVLPWVDNGNIRHHVGVLRQEGKLSGKQFVRAINRWLYQVILGLVYLHEEQVIHGDLHGANILIDDEDNVRLTDFGYGLLADETPRHYASKHGGGAYQYRAPELLDPREFDLDHNAVTTASDMYAFACVCVELYTERPPFEGATYYRVGTDVLNGKRPPRPVTRDGELISESMWNIVERCWAQQPRERPSAQRVAMNILDDASTSWDITQNQILSGGFETHLPLATQHINNDIRDVISAVVQNSFDADQHTIAARRLETRRVTPPAALTSSNPTLLKVEANTDYSDSAGRCLCCCIA